MSIHYTNVPCRCGQSPDYSYWLLDGYGIPMKRVCDKCKKDVLKKYRPDIMTRYETEEVIEPEDTLFLETVKTILRIGEENETRM